jgi:predicted PolB exonuclease-like 3'-5' exonuclease
MALYSKARLVTFNGRCFDMPLLELAAFRYGYSPPDEYLDTRNRYKTPAIDLLDVLSNFGACRMDGGLDLLAKMIGMPGKMDVKGEDVYRMYLEGKLQEINDYCLCDTLDTYFVFLRTRILAGYISVERETELKVKAKEFLESKIADFPILRTYIEKWTDCSSP